MTNAVVILLRGVNVGGGGTRLPMSELGATLESLGARNVRTYIQSGNAVALWNRPPEDLAAALSDAITLPNGSHPAALVLSGDAFLGALARNPFPDAAPKALHFFFADRDVALDFGRLSARRQDEAFEVFGRVLYLFTPSGFGHSAVASAVEGAMRPARVTARNLATVRALAALLQGLA